MSNCRICYKEISYCEYTCESKTCKQKFEKYEKELTKLQEEHKNKLTKLQKIYFHKNFFNTEEDDE